MSRANSLYGLVFLLTTILVGCANPAADAPDAAVSEPPAEAPVHTPQPAAEPEGSVYVIGPGSTLAFVGSKVTGSHDGGFKSIGGDVTVVDGQANGSRVRVSIDATSLWSDNERLTGHLKSADFFDVENFPTASFESASVQASEETPGQFTITGDLDLHGVSKRISFPASIELSDAGVTANAEFSIKRSDFGIVYPGKPDDLIRDEVLVKLSLAAQPAA